MIKCFNTSKKQGFTVLEILVIIVIVGFLVTLGFVGTNLISNKTRNALRIADIRSIQNALELYRRDNGFYPPALTMGAPLISPNKAKTYMNQVPSNPSPRDNGGGCTKSDYVYSQLNPLSYALQYCLTSDTSNPNGGTANSAGGNTSGVIAKAGPYEATPQGTLRTCISQCQSLNRDLGASDGCGGTCDYYLSKPNNQPTSFLVKSITRLLLGVDMLRGGGNAILITTKPISASGTDARLTFNVTGVNNPPAIGDTYTNNGQIYVIESLALNGTAGTITVAYTNCLSSNTNGLLPTSGNLIKTNGFGDASIAYNVLNFDLPLDGTDYIHPVGEIYGTGTLMGTSTYSVYTSLSSGGMAAVRINGLTRNTCYLIGAFEYNQQSGFKSRYLSPGVFRTVRTSP